MRIAVLEQDEAITALEAVRLQLAKDQEVRGVVNVQLSWDTGSRCSIVGQAASLSVLNRLESLGTVCAVYNRWQSSAITVLS